MHLQKVSLQGLSQTSIRKKKGQFLEVLATCLEEVPWHQVRDRAKEKHNKMCSMLHYIFSIFLLKWEFRCQHQLSVLQQGHWRHRLSREFFHRSDLLLVGTVSISGTPVKPPQFVLGGNQCSCVVSCQSQPDSRGIDGCSQQSFGMNLSLTANFWWCPKLSIYFKNNSWQPMLLLL